LPIAEGRAHERQAPWQGSAQHTPSTQKVLAHSVPFTHDCPFCLGPQLPATQACPAWQSASVVHFVLQAPAAHLKGAQARTPGGRQTPLPSQVPAVFRRSPAHVGAWQIVSAGYSAQPPKPSQVPFWPHDAAPSFLQTWRGSTTPRSIGQHVPSRPTWLHELQAPWQATLQQTPSAQKPEAQSAFLVQTAARGFGPQLPATHLTASAQSESDLHETKHLFVDGSQSKGAQTVEGPGLQRAAESQT
jgi:hypothetical protein